MRDTFVFGSLTVTAFRSFIYHLGKRMGLFQHITSTNENDARFASATPPPAFFFSDDPPRRRFA